MIRTLVVIIALAFSQAVFGQVPIDPESIREVKLAVPAESSECSQVEIYSGLPVPSEYAENKMVFIPNAALFYADKDTILTGEAIRQFLSSSIGTDLVPSSIIAVERTNLFSKRNGYGQRWFPSLSTEKDRFHVLVSESKTAAFKTQLRELHRVTCERGAKKFALISLSFYENDYTVIYEILILK